MDKLVDVNYIADLCRVKRGSIVSYIKYCAESGIEIPNPVPYQSSKYVYTIEDAKTIAEMFRNKKRGEMAEYNYKHCWGKKIREKYPRNSKQKSAETVEK